MYWDSMWDNVKLFSLMWRKNKIVSEFVKAFISDKFYQRFHLIKNLHTQKIRSSVFSKKYNVFFLQAMILNFSKILKSYPVFTSKVWFFSYQRWVVVKVLLYFSTRKKFKIPLSEEYFQILKFKNQKLKGFTDYNFENLYFKKYSYITANYILKHSKKVSNEKVSKLKYF